VVANELNTTNTHLAVSATIAAGQATGGSAVMKVNGAVILTDTTILADDTSVNFTTSDGSPTNAELQATIAAGGVVTVEVTDAAGNMTASSVANPTLVVDYTVPTAFTYSASSATTTGTVTATFSANFTGTIGLYTDVGGTDPYKPVVAITNTTSGSVSSTNPGVQIKVFVVIKDAGNAIVGDVRPVILGIGGASIVNGSGDSEIIFGFEGPSTINAGGGDNIIIGGTGVDNINTGDGNNIIKNGAGDDVIFTGSGNDIITGGAGIKTINSGAGNDIISGGAVADVLTGGDGNDNITGLAGADIFVWASADVDTTAGAVIDIITDYGSGGADSIKGSWGAGAAGNFFNSSATPFADLATLLSAADTKLDGTFKYYVGRVGDDQYLVTDSDGIGYTDVIQLTGFTAGFLVGQIVA
jgi:Ca2+-binding RTX toxin-like protein